MWWFSKFHKEKLKGRAREVLLGVILCLVAAHNAQGYVMPAEQILEFTAKNFSVFKTVIIEQSVRQNTREYEGTEVAYREMIWMQSPDGFRSERLDDSGDREIFSDRRYQKLLMAGTRGRLAGLFAAMGIDLQTVTFTRVDGIVAYRIGDKANEKPKVYIEKKRFLPVLLTYSLPAEDGAVGVTVAFRDYRKVVNSWYPFQIAYTQTNGFSRVSNVLDLKANAPIAKTLFKVPVPVTENWALSGSPPSKGTEEALMPSEKERLRSILKAFEEKYR